MRKNPLVTIIVPVYNMEKYLNRCLESIVEQTYKNIEIVVVDDGSMDNSGSIVENYAKEHKTIKIIHKKNGGLSSARNVGIDNAHGEWLAFVDSDDYIEKDYIEELMRVATRCKKVSIVTCTFKGFSDDGTILKRSIMWPEGKLSGHDALIDMLKNKRPAYIWLNLVKRELFNNVSFPEDHNYEDIETKIKLLSKAENVFYINKELYNYRQRNDSITSEDFSNKKCQDYIKAIDGSLLLLNDIDDAGYGKYFELYSLFAIINDIAKSKYKKENNKYWKRISKRIRKVYNHAKFPSIKKKIEYGILTTLTTFRCVYKKTYNLYRRKR